MLEVILYQKNSIKRAEIFLLILLIAMQVIFMIFTAHYVLIENTSSSKSVKKELNNDEHVAFPLNIDQQRALVEASRNNETIRQNSNLMHQLLIDKYMKLVILILTISVFIEALFFYRIYTDKNGNEN